MNISSNISFRRYLLLCGTGFGLGGLLWGLVLYRELPNLEFPFHYLAIPIMALCGGISLALPTKNLKQILKSVLAGFFGWGVGFLVSAVFGYYLVMLSIFMLGSFLPSSFDERLIGLEPGVSVGAVWLVFFAVGIIVGSMFLLFFRARKFLVLKTGISLALASLVGPIIGNLLGSLFNSILISYSMTFFVICFTFGWFLSSAVYKEN